MLAPLALLAPLAALAPGAGPTEPTTELTEPMRAERKAPLPTRTPRPTPPR